MESGGIACGSYCWEKALRRRFSDKAARWIVGEAAKRSEVSVETLDLQACQRLFDDPVSPSSKTNRMLMKRWRASRKESQRATHLSW